MENNACCRQKQSVVMDKVSCTSAVEETNPTISSDPDSESVMYQHRKIISWGNVSDYNNNIDRAMEDIQMETSNKEFKVYGPKQKFLRQYIRENKRLHFITVDVRIKSGDYITTTRKNMEFVIISATSITSGHRRKEASSSDKNVINWLLYINFTTKLLNS